MPALFYKITRNPAPGFLFFFLAMPLALSGCGGSAGNEGEVGSTPAPAPIPIPSPAPANPAVGHQTFLSPHASPIAKSGDFVFVANTQADTVDVIRATDRSIVRRIHVGVDPVAVAARPDEKEIWVANHVSDSVSVIDSDPASPTYLQVVATVQDFDPVTRATRFDEPVGIAFADDTKAYVALSSDNKIAVVEVAERRVRRTLDITAQDPRAIAVRGDRLYVLPFESGNRTQLSGCGTGPGQAVIDGDLCTFDAWDIVVEQSIGIVSAFADVDIVKNPDVPDRDLYVFDTQTDELIEVVDDVGTLLYGLAVDSQGRVFVAQTDARNEINGRAGTLGQGLAENENRMFLNQLSRIDCSSDCAAPERIDLEPLPPQHPAPHMASATPYGIEISEDDATLIVTAAGSNKLVTVDAASGAVLGRASVGAVPRGIALESDAEGKPLLAWVYNAVANTVSQVQLSDVSNPVLVSTITLEDPTPPVMKRGRMAFNDANASTTGTFSCESCHPDGHTDQLLWILSTPPACSIEGCDGQTPPRSTMPVRGLRDTAPHHWDGIPGDPHGGNNTANIDGDLAPNCNLDEPASCTRFLVDDSLANVMCTVGGCPTNDEGKSGSLSAAERDDMATFLLNIPYPPAPARAYDNTLSQDAENGFERFHLGVGGEDCGSCHRMPLWTSTNTPASGMDAPTWRGANDRWLVFPNGRDNIFDLLTANTTSVLADGLPEKAMWLNENDDDPFTRSAWSMATEGSTGYPGSFARQLTLNQTSADDTTTIDLLAALEQSAAEGAVLLQGEGIFLDGPQTRAAAFQFLDDAYVEGDNTFSRAELLSLAVDGRFVGTFTARLGALVDIDRPQPLLWSVGPMHEQRGPEVFPTLSADLSVVISGRHVVENARLFVDGRRVDGSVSCQSGTLPDCIDETIVVSLAEMPTVSGLHFLQVQNPNGLISNDYLFFTAE